MAWLIAMQLLVLHRLDGGEILVNPTEITFLSEPRKNRATMNPATRCIVFLSDRHFLDVLETCAAVRRLLER